MHGVDLPWWLPVIVAVLRFLVLVLPILIIILAAFMIASIRRKRTVAGDAEVGHRTMYGLDFGEPQRVETRQGITYVREAAPTEQFWWAWRQDKEAVKAAGFSLGKFHDEWSVRYWSDSEDCPLP